MLHNSYSQAVPIRFDPQFAIDVLSDGSEDTGFPSVFLSVYNNKTCDNESLKARYAVSGLGDLVSRLAADQRYKLGQVRATFCPTEKSQNGLPSLQIALHQAGSPSLSIIAGNTDLVENVIHLLESRRRHPQIQLCQVPVDQPSSWWLVYEDEFIISYAYRHDSCVFFLYCLISRDHRGLLFIPPGGSCKAAAILQHNELPCHRERIVRIECIISLNEKAQIQYIQVPTYYTMPRRQRDPNLLVRAQRASQAYHDADSDHFPWYNCKASEIENIDKYRIVSGCSLLLQDDYQILDRCQGLRSGVDDSGPERVTSLHPVHELRDFLQFPSNVLKNDENEIDLEEEFEGEAICSHCPRLYVLGTGCAAPSPHRGGSAYVMSLSDDVSVVFEAGEGFVTQWYRHVLDRGLDTIRLIWISHAHWDHYGGLLHLLEKIKESKRVGASGSGVKRNRDDVPFVMAPPEILSYLHGATGSRGVSLFRSVFPHDEQAITSVLTAIDSLSPSTKIVNWRNILVKHSCRDSYGFCCELKTKDRTIHVAFSGDTVRCPSFERVCESKGLDLLIHEATFNDDDINMAITKKHSTVSDAISAAHACRARRLLLTHFSQRYGSSTRKECGLVSTLKAPDSLVIGFAVDGLVFAL